MFQWLGEEKLNKSIDTVSKVVQIAALAIAGWWAYKQFFMSVKPGLEFRGTVEANVDFNKSSDPGDCVASLDITIKNDGVSSFDVSRILVRGWLYTSDAKLSGPTDISIAKPTVTTPVFVQYDRIEQEHPFYEHEYTDQDRADNLVGHYPQGISLHQASSWIFKKSKGQRVLFKVDVTTAGNVTQFVPSAWVTDDVCNIPDEASKKND